MDIVAVEETRHWLELDNPGPETLPTPLEAVLRLSVEVGQCQHEVEAVMSLGHEYPSVALPEIYVR